MWIGVLPDSLGGMEASPGLVTLFGPGPGLSTRGATQGGPSCQTSTGAVGFTRALPPGSSTGGAVQRATCRAGAVTRG